MPRIRDTPIAQDRMSSVANLDQTWDAPSFINESRLASHSHSIRNLEHIHVTEFDGHGQGKEDR